MTKTKDVLSESLGFDELPLREEELIGFVMIRISKENFTEQLKKLLLMSVIILVLFLVAAFFASYFIAKRISKPLNRLIDSVHTIEMGMDTEKVPVGTRDEIGLLAEAFNDMTESLKKREDDLKALNSALLMQDKERKALSKRLIDLLEKDREHVAMELHDHIGQTLTSLKINLEIMQGQLDPGHSSLEASLKSSRERAVQALRDIKQISRGLKPSVLDALGLVSSLRELLNEVKINTGINFKFFTHRIPEKFGKEKELAIYRITQEALNNIIKHANAGTVFISLVEKDGKISLSIEDDGVGFELEKTMEFTDGRGYLGLLIMRERAEQLRGEFNIESKAGKGTLLLVEIPI